MLNYIHKLKAHKEKYLLKISSVTTLLMVTEDMDFIANSIEEFSVDDIRFIYELKENNNIISNEQIYEHMMERLSENK